MIMEKSDNRKIITGKMITKNDNGNNDNRKK